MFEIDCWWGVCWI